MRLADARLQGCDAFRKLYICIMCRRNRIFVHLEQSTSRKRRVGFRISDGECRLRPDMRAANTNMHERSA